MVVGELVVVVTGPVVDVVLVLDGCSVVVVTFGQQILAGHSLSSSPSQIRSSSVSTSQPASDSHSKIGHWVSLSVPAQISLLQAGHSGVGRGLQMVDLQPHSSILSTTISQGRHEATLIAGQSRSTHSFSAAQQHSVPSTRLTIFWTWHLLHFGSSMAGHFNSFSSQHLHGRHCSVGQQLPSRQYLSAVVSLYSPLRH